MENLKRSLNSFIKWKGARRIAAAIMAVIVVLVSIDLSGLTTIAENEAGGIDPSLYPYPYYSPVKTGGDGAYHYNTNDVLYAATHVHLFARNNVSITAHTNGNIFAGGSAYLGHAFGSHSNSLYDTYKELSYIQTNIQHIQSADLDLFVVGSQVGGGETGATSGQMYWVNTTEQSPKNLDGVKEFYCEDTTTAIDFNREFGLLEGRSLDFAKRAENTDVAVTYDLSDDGRYINVGGLNANQDVFMNVTYDQWVGTGRKPILISGLDADPNNTGILIINIDMTGVTTENARFTTMDTFSNKYIELGGSDSSINGSTGMCVITSQGSFVNREYDTDEYGICRILFNLYERDASGQPQVYRGNASFSNMTMGSILAPGADLRVEAVNGTVVGNNIVHEGKESHRMDLVPISGSGTNTSDAYLDIELYKTFDGNVLTNASILAATEFRLYTNPACEGTPLATAYPHYDSASGRLKVTFQALAEERSFDGGGQGNTIYIPGCQTFYIKEYSTSFNYETSSDIYVCNVEYNQDTKKVGKIWYWIYDPVAEDHGESSKSESLLTCDNTSRSTTQTGVNISLYVNKIYSPHLPIDEIQAEEYMKATHFTLYDSFDAAKTGDESVGNPNIVLGPQAPNRHDIDGSDVTTTFHITGDKLPTEEQGTVTYYLRESSVPSEVWNSFEEKDLLRQYIENNTIYAIIITNNNDGSYTIQYALCAEDGNIAGEYVDGYPTFTNYTQTTSGEDQEETTNPTPVSAILNINKTFSDGFGDLDSTTVSNIIESTTFGLYNDSSCSDKVTDVTFRATTTGKAQTITYTATVSNITAETTYYIKETGTNETYYNLDSSTIWKVVISADGETVTYTLVTGGTSTSNTEAAKFTNTRVVTEPDPTPTPVTVSVSLEKTFNNFGNLTSNEQTSVKNATNFRLYAEDYKTWLDVTFTAGVTAGNKVTYSTGEFTVEIPADTDHVTYYLKEIATDTNYYELNNLTTWRVEIYEDGHVVYTPIVGQSSGNGNVAEFINNSEALTRTATVSFVKVFSDNFADLDEDTIKAIIGRTTFTLYEDKALSRAVVGFNQVGNVTWDSVKHQIVYTFTVPVILMPGESVTYYLKETGTDTRYYDVDNTVYSVKITLPKDSTQATVEYGDANGANFKADVPTFTNSRNSNTQEGTTPKVDEVTVELIKTFTGFDAFGADQDTIIGATAFALYDNKDCSGNPMGTFRQTKVVRDSDTITYYFSLSVSDLMPGQSVIYYLKETKTDSRYTVSKAVWAVQITISEDGTKATVLYGVYKDANGTTVQNVTFGASFPNFVNTVKANDPSGSTGGNTPGGDNTNTPSNPNTPTNPSNPGTGDNNNNNNGGGGSNNNNTGSTNNGGGSSNGGNNSTNTPGGNLLLTGNPGTSTNNSATGSNNSASATGGANDVTSGVTGTGLNTVTESATDTMSSSTAPQTGESNAPFAVFGGSMAMIFIVGTVYVWRKKETIEEA